MDFGGVEFDIPSGWEVTDITSSYPNSSTNEPGIIIMEGGSQSVEIGNQINAPWSPPDGGSGSVVIELAANPQGQKPAEALKITVGVGSDESDETIEMSEVIEVTENSSDGVHGNVTQEHYKIMYPDFEVIEVPIIQQ
jgi:hypothetical protein